MELPHPTCNMINALYVSQWQLKSSLTRNTQEYNVYCVNYENVYLVKWCL